MLLRIIRYWDWALDAVSEDAWTQSPVFDEVYGFGGNGGYIEDISNLTLTSATEDIPGRTGGDCVTTGPFANLSVPMGPRQQRRVYASLSAT